jgi:hypothetical protein
VRQKINLKQALRAAVVGVWCQNRMVLVRDTLIYCFYTALNSCRDLYLDGKSACAADCGEAQLISTYQEFERRVCG